MLTIDKNGEAFRFAPRVGETFQRMVPKNVREVLPPSIVVLAADGRVLTRSAAVLHILKQLGGIWKCLGMAGSIVPSSLRDVVYKIIARVRHRIFSAPEGLCPVVAPELMKRFAP